MWHILKGSATIFDNVLMKEMMVARKERSHRVRSSMNLSTSVRL